MKCNHCKTKMILKAHPIGSGMVFFDCERCKNTRAAALEDVWDNVTDLVEYRRKRAEKKLFRVRRR